MSEKQESTITKKFKVYRLNLQNLKKSKHNFPRKIFIDKAIQKIFSVQQIPLKVTRSIYKIAKSQKKNVFLAKTSLTKPWNFDKYH